MTPALTLALLVAAAPAPSPSARVYLKPAAAAAPSCRTKPAEGGLVTASLFAPESERCPVAVVGEETIVLAELASAVEFMHTGRPLRAPGGKAPALDFGPPLDRLIQSRLLVQEAREMQLDQSPEFLETMADFRAERQRAMLQAVATSGVKPDPAEVDRLYRDAVKEWKLASVLLEKEEDAKTLQAELAAGKRFDALTTRYVKEGKGKGGGPAQFAPRKQMLPAVLEAVKDAKQGSVVGPVRVPMGWVVLRVEAFRYPKGDAEALEKAKAASLARLEQEAVRKFYDGLIAKYARVDRALLDGLDLEAGGEKGFEALLADTRPLVTIAGEAPITVGELTKEVSMKFFHGLEGPIRDHRVNPQKQPAFEKLIGARLFAKEAAARKLEEEPTYLREVAAFQRMQTFNAFVERVIVPDVKVTEGEAQGLYQDHLAEYSSPEMFKLDGFAFATSQEAQVALDKLKAGTDFGWLRTNAPGQLEPARRTLHFDGQTLSVGGMPAGLARAVTGAKTGEYRLYAASPGEVYVVKVVAQTPPQPRPYVEVRENVVKQLFAEKVTRGIQDYAGKLRGAQKVDVLVTRVAL